MWSKVIHSGRLANNAMGKNEKKMKKYCFIVVLFFVAFVSRAQSLPIGEVGTEDMLRALQLEGKIDESYSFTARPFIYQKNLDISSMPASGAPGADRRTDFAYFTIQE